MSNIGSWKCIKDTVLHHKGLRFEFKKRQIIYVSKEGPDVVMVEFPFNHFWTSDVDLNNFEKLD